MYIKSGNEIFFGKVHTFICQRGGHGVRVVGDNIPVLEGFKVFTDNDKELADYTAYNTLYREVEGANEYSDDGSEFVNHEGGTDPIPPTPYEQLSSRISSVSSRVSSVENDMTQIDNILGEEVMPNVESDDIETNEGDV